MLVLVVVAGFFAAAFGVVVVGVLAEVDVLDVAGGDGVVALPTLLVVGLDPPHPAIASAAINAPETPKS